MILNLVVSFPLNTRADSIIAHNNFSSSALSPILQEETVHLLINELFMWIFPSSLAFVRDNCRELVATSNSNLAVCYMRIIDCMLKQVVEVIFFGNTAL